MILKSKLLGCLGSIGFVLLITSCNPEKRINHDYNYFQRGVDSIKTLPVTEYKLQESDIISVQVIAGSIRQDDAALFNLSASSNTAINATNLGVVANSTSAQGNYALYLIDPSGNIELPKVGKVKAVGLTKYQLAEAIRVKVIDEVKDPMVIVKLAQFKISVLGEVRKPGVITFKTDKANVLDALSEAGDLTEFGKREDVMLLRQANGKYETYKIDLRNTAFINSPSFQLQQNDMIYVGANKNKLKAVNVDPNLQRDFSMILSTISTIAILLNTYIIVKNSK